jgi:hypothetical protein
MNTTNKNLIEKYIENNFLGKLLGMYFTIISDGLVDYLPLIKFI